MSFESQNIEFARVFTPTNRLVEDAHFETSMEPVNEREEAVTTLIARFGSYSDYVNDECVLASNEIPFSSERIEDSWISGRNFKPLSLDRQLHYLTNLQKGFEEYSALNGRLESLDFYQEDTFKTALQSRQVLIVTSQKLVGRAILDMPLWKFQQPGLNNVDMYHEGLLGLIKAVDRFEISKGVNLSTYAYLWIRQSIDLAFHRAARTIRLPLPVEREFREIARYGSILETKLGRSPTIEEISNETGIAVEEIVKAKQFVRVGSLFEGNVVEKEKIELIDSKQDTPSEERLFFEEFYKHAIEHGFSKQDFAIFVLMYPIQGSFLDHIEVKLSDDSVSSLGKLQGRLVKHRGDMNLSRDEIQTILNGVSKPDVIRVLKNMRFLLKDFLSDWKAED